MRRELRALGWEPSDFGAFFDRRLVQAMADRWGRVEIEWSDCSQLGFIPNLPRVASQMRAFIDACTDRSF